HERVDRLHLPGKGPIAAGLQDPLPPLLPRPVPRLYIFFFQMSDLIKGASDIRLFQVNFFHCHPFPFPCKSYTPCCLLYRSFDAIWRSYPSERRDGPLPGPSSAHIFPASPSPPALWRRVPC